MGTRSDLRPQQPPTTPRSDASPTPARPLCQIDSHIWFVDGWDAQLVHAMRIAPSKKPVLSTYPPGSGGEHWKGAKGPRMCGASFSSSPVEARIIRLGASMGMAQPAVIGGR